MSKRANPDSPWALVLDCRGAAEGAISVVRSLGRRGVRVAVLADSEGALSARSRFCEERHVLPAFTQRSTETLELLRRFASSRPVKPVLFPTADPDLLLVSQWRGELSKHFQLFLARADVLEAFSDKRRFLDLAVQLGFPVPATYLPSGRADLERIAARVRYPVVVKPSQPSAWTDARLQAVVDYKKALVVADRASLVEVYDRIAPLSDDLLVQEYIEGPDDAHYSLHAYLDRESDPVACFTGRKVRVYPVRVGSGCYVRSVRVRPMVEVGLGMLRQVRYTGIATINFKQDARTGEFRVHEINPRISQWNVLATRCGIDIPYIAYADTVGIEYARPGVQAEGVHYVHLKNDLKAFAALRRTGEWTWASYLASLARRPMVHQCLARDDMRPLFTSYWQGLLGLGRRFAGLVRRRAPGVPRGPESTLEIRHPLAHPSPAPRVAKHQLEPAGSVAVEAGRERER